MAIYEWQMQTINRADGRSTVAAAAYRAGVRLEDERTGEVHDFTRKRGIDFSALVGWTASRDALWNAVEFAEKRKDSRLAREIVVAIPAELSKELREAMMLEYAEALRSRWGVAVDFSIHKPHGKGSDARNVHAHLMLTSRTCVDNQLGEKTRVLDKHTLAVREGLIFNGDLKPGAYTLQAVVFDQASGTYAKTDLPVVLAPAQPNQSAQQAVQADRP